MHIDRQTRSLLLSLILALAPLARSLWLGGFTFFRIVIYALVRALCPGALRAGLLRAAWRTAKCAWRWRKAGGFLPHSSFVFSKRKLQKLCGSLGGLSPCECVC